MLRKSLQLSPKYKDAYLDEGVLLTKMGKNEQAIHVWRQGQQLYPSDQRFKDYLAKVLK